MDVLGLPFISIAIKCIDYTRVLEGLIYYTAHAINQVSRYLTISTGCDRYWVRNSCHYQGKRVNNIIHSKHKWLFHITYNVPSVIHQQYTGTTRHVPENKDLSVSYATINLPRELGNL